MFEKILKRSSKPTPSPPPNLPETEQVLPNTILLAGQTWKHFSLSQKQAKMLVNNLPSNLLKSLLATGQFQVKQSKATVIFSLSHSITYGRVRPTVELIINSTALNPPCLLNFNLDGNGEQDPIVTLVVLWIMYRDCPKAFLLTPCNSEHYKRHLYTSTELTELTEILSLGAVGRSVYESPYSFLKGYFQRKGGEK